MIELDVRGASRVVAGGYLLALVSLMGLVCVMPRMPWVPLVARDAGRGVRLIML